MSNAWKWIGGEDQQSRSYIWKVFTFSSFSSSWSKTSAAEDLSGQGKNVNSLLKDSTMDQSLKACNKNLKHLESRKRENPTRFALMTEQSSSFGCSTDWICENSACRAILSIHDTFCRRCSCCICHKFDDNKDPSLWLVCESDSAQDDSCGLSCHIECAFRQEKLGVVNIGKYMHLDGCYCCVSCGKLYGILGCLIKQLAIGKDARLLDVLCCRIFVSYRLLKGTDKFKDLHGIITEAKTMLEAEVGPVNGDSMKMARSTVSRLAVGEDVQKLCSDAFNKANGLIADVSSLSSNGYVVSLPAACRFLFEEVTSTSLAIILINIPTPINESIIGYKLWYSKSQQESFSEELYSIFPKEISKILVKRLQPCTEYTFKIISYTEAGDLGHSEAKCLTKSAEILKKKINLGGSSSGSKVRDLHQARAQEQGCLDDACSVVNGCTLKYAAGPDAAGASNGVEKNGLEVVRSNGSGPSDGSQTQPHIQKGDVPSVNSVAETSRKRGSNGFFSLDCFENCLKVIVRLEKEGYIETELRLKFLSWLVRSTEQECHIIDDLIRRFWTLGPKCLAEQLVDVYEDIMTSKRPRNSFTRDP